MRVSQKELILVALLIAYSAFFTHPAPRHLKDFLCSPVGKALGLLGVLYVTVYQSLIVGVFLAIAYILTAGSVTEYLDEKEQKPKEPEVVKVPPHDQMQGLIWIPPEDTKLSRDIPVIRCQELAISVSELIESAH